MTAAPSLAPITTSSPAAGRTIVYYDGTCPICDAEICHYRAQPGSDTLAFVDVSRVGADLGQGLDKQRAMARFHVRRADGTLVSGAAAFSELWQQLPRWRRIGRIAALPLVRSLLEAGYRASLIVRPPLSALSRRLSRR